MADLKINTTYQQDPYPLNIGTTVADAMAGDRIPWTFLVRVTGNTTIQIYTQREIPANTWLAFNLQYRSGNSEGNTTFAAATGFSQDVTTSVRGGGGKAGDNCFMAGYFTNTVTVAVNTWTTIGTISGRSASAVYYGIGVRY